jgi:hypothetical protein
MECQYSEHGLIPTWFPSLRRSSGSWQVSAATQTLAFNGIDGASGGYLLPPLTAEQVAQLAQGQHLRELKWYHQRATEAVMGPKEGVDPTDLAQTGWGSSSPTTPTRL